MNSPDTSNRHDDCALTDLARAFEAATGAVTGLTVVANGHSTPCQRCGSTAVPVRRGIDRSNHPHRPRRSCAFCGAPQKLN